MKRLLILRHAKAEPPNGTPDRQRRLVSIGRSDAGDIGRSLRSRKLEPDVILASSSARTIETSEIVQGMLEGAPEILPLDELYNCGPDDVMKVIAAFSPDAVMPLIVGHNPAMENLAGALSGAPVELKTAHLAVLEFEAPRGTGPAAQPRARLLELITPGRRA